MGQPQEQRVTFRKPTMGADKRLRELSANELVFAVVGPVGSGTSWVATSLQALLKNPTYGMEVHVIKASDVIANYVATTTGGGLDNSSTYAKVLSLQNAGDEMRSDDPAAVAVELISAIKSVRESLQKNGEVVTNLKPAEKAIKRAYVLDSLKHPAEVELLRAIYQDSFCLIGVVCEEKVRENRLAANKCQNTGLADIKILMARDEDDIGKKHGQKVTDTFHLADFFVDNSPSRFTDDERTIPNPLWVVNDQLGRLVDLLTVRTVIRPSSSETGMFHAYGAKMRSACLSRQVGAALLDKRGNLVSTGTNEVPRSGGGVYGGVFEDPHQEEHAHDDRCVVTKQYCSSNRAQAEIIDEIIAAIPELSAVSNKIDLAKKLKKETPIGRLLEFSRAVHAEMDALLSAARTGATTVGTRLFVTTFPCHYCARHLVSAGVDEVQFIEPYPKSRALSLHGDAITTSVGGWVAPSSNVKAVKDGLPQPKKVLFRPFTGVAPRLYRRVFLKDRSLKNENGQFEIGEADWARGLLRLSYQDVEASVLADRSGG